MYNMYMEKLKKCVNMKLLPIAVLLIITPLLSTSLRFKYLYIIVNILVIAVGADAGLLSFFLQSEDNKEPVEIISQVSSVKEERASSYKEKSDNGTLKEPVKVCSPEKVSGGDGAVTMEKSRPSIFFIGGGERSHAEELMEESEGEEGGDLSGQELYQKSEIFIGNFYKQLKMQREESWKKLHHHLSQRAF